MSRALLQYVSALSVAVACGCGSEAHPGPAGEAPREVGSEPTTLGPSHVCDPPSSQQCRHYYKNPSGQMNCPLDYEICRPDGTGWLPCGEYDFDEHNEPVPRYR